MGREGGVRWDVSTRVPWEIGGWSDDCARFGTAEDVAAGRVEDFVRFASHVGFGVL